jgi:hypothetical protein
MKKQAEPFVLEYVLTLQTGLFIPTLKEYHHVPCPSQTARHVF